MFCSELDFSNHSDRDESALRPMSLKQRTSSSTDRRDFTPSTWISLLELIKFREYLITVNHFSIWRRHNAWAMEDGNDLKAYITQRYASAMVFMSLLLSTEFGVLFNSSDITKQVRENLAEAHWDTVGFWAGLFIIVSALFTILSLISTFTFSAMISAIDEANAHCILRSSIGQYATELPGRLIVGSIYTFLISFMSFFFLLLPVGYFSFCLLLGTVGLFVHVVSVFSSFGRVIMHTGAMSKVRIFSNEYEESLVPHSLHSNLLAKAKCNIQNNISIIRQYRKNKQKPIDRYLLEKELYDHLCGRTEISYGNGGTITSNRKRADSKVRFADEEAGRTPNATEEKETNPQTIESSSSSGGRPTYGSLSRHVRSLTPLSDVSEVSTTHHTRQLSSVRSELTDDFRSMTTTTPSSRFFGTGDRALDFPMQREDSAVSSVFTVSNESLEKWVQGSPIIVKEKDENQSKTNNGHGNTETNGGTKDIPPPLLPAILPKTVSVSTNMWSSSDSNDTSEADDKHSGNENGDSIKRPPNLTSKPLPYRRTIERDMSEDERFIFDYGDFGNESAEGEKISMDETTKLENYDWGSTVESIRNNFSAQSERARLLE
eukprot:jgi/Psemu1/317241/estExt_fgenesh1_pm.C_30007